MELKRNQNVFTSLGYFVPGVIYSLLKLEGDCCDWNKPFPRNYRTPIFIMLDCSASYHHPVKVLPYCEYGDDNYYF